MNEPCSDHCPFLGCASCDYAGGPVENPAGGVGSNCENGSAPIGAAPAGNRRLTAQSDRTGKGAGS